MEISIFKMHPVKHLKRIRKHRKLVRQYCFRLGLYVQGITHDLSKYSPQEFLAGAKYYSDKRNPIASERREKGLSEAWLHHKGRNKHHPEYWVDYRFEADGSLGFGNNKMPRKYVAEMFCDYIAASRIYLGDKYTNQAPLERFRRDSSFRMIHPDTAKELKEMLEMLCEHGEKETFKYLRKEIPHRMNPQALIYKEAFPEQNCRAGENNCGE